MHCTYILYLLLVAHLTNALNPVIGSKLIAFAKTGLARTLATPGPITKTSQKAKGKSKKPEVSLARTPAVPGRLTTYNIRHTIYEKVLVRSPESDNIEPSRCPHTFNSPDPTFFTYSLTW